MKRTRTFSVVIEIALLGLLAGCEFDVPITAEPTRRIEPALLGNWKTTEVSESADCRDRMKVRRYDDSTYIVSYDGELHRAHHSDVGEIPLVSVQNIDSGKQKYSYFTWRLSGDGKKLYIRMVSDKLIPKETRDSAAVVRLIRENAGNPALFADATEFQKD